MFKTASAREVTFSRREVRPGVQTSPLSKERNTAGQRTFRLEPGRDIADGGKFNELFLLLPERDDGGSPGGYQEVTWNGRTFRYFVNWVLDNNNTMKGMQYFSPYGGDLVDLLRETQKPDGMIWSFVNTGEEDYHYYETAYTSLGYFRHDRDAWFVAPAGGESCRVQLREHDVPVLEGERRQ